MERRERISNTLKSRWTKIKHHQIGKRLSKEQKEKISSKLMGNKYAIGNKNRLGKIRTQEEKLKISKSLQEYYKNKPKRYCSRLNCNEIHYGKTLCKKHYDEIIYKPHSRKDLSLELQIAMNNVRLRYNNICQWQNCNKQGRGIQVHHIFPRNEYPELELIESYMICYCKNHHSKFHEMRGDTYYGFIRGNN